MSNAYAEHHQIISELLKNSVVEEKASSVIRHRKKYYDVLTRSKNPLSTDHILDRLRVGARDTSVVPVDKSNIPKAIKVINKHLRDLSEWMGISEFEPIMIHGWHEQHDYLRGFVIKNATVDQVRLIVDQAIAHVQRPDQHDLLASEAFGGFKERLRPNDPSAHRPLGLELYAASSRDEQSSYRDIWHGELPHDDTWTRLDFESLRKPDQHYLVVSGAGSGKTTLLRHLQYTIAEHDRLLPLFFRATVLEHLRPLPSKLVPHLVESYGDCIGHPSHEYFRIALREGRVVLLVDGLDKIRSGNAVELVRELLGAVRASKVILTSQPTTAAWVKHLFPGGWLRLRAFTEDDQHAYFGDDFPHAAKIIRDDPELGAVPLFACMLRSLLQNDPDSVVRNRADLHGKYIDHLVHDHTPNLVTGDHQLRTDVLQSLERIAYEAIDQHEPQLQSLDLRLANEFKASPSLRVDDLAVFGLADVLDRRDGGSSPCLEFAHQSYQEYFAARWITEDRTSQRLDHVLEEIWHPKWRDVIKFIAGIRGEAFVKSICPASKSDNCIHARLMLAAECAGDGGLSPETMDRLLKQLTGLASRPPFAREARQRIGRLGTLSAIQWLWQSFDRQFEAGNREHAVAILRDMAEARVVLSQERIRALLDMILSEGKQERDLIHATARCLAQSPTLRDDDVRFIHHRTQHADPAVRFAAVEMLWCFVAKLSEEDVLSVLDLVCDPDQLVRLAVRRFAMALGGSHAESAPARLLTYASHTDASVRTAALRCISPLQASLDDDQIEQVLSCLGDPEVGVREAAENALRAAASRFTDEHMTRLRDCLESPDKAMRIEAIKVACALPQSMDDRHIKLMLQGFDDDDEQIRKAAISAAASMGSRIDHAHIDKILPCVDHPDHWVSEAAAYAIGELFADLNIEQKRRYVECAFHPDPHIARTVVDQLLHLCSRLDETASEQIIKTIETCQLQLRTDEPSGDSTPTREATAAPDEDVTTVGRALHTIAAVTLILGLPALRWMDAFRLDVRIIRCPPMRGMIRVEPVMDDVANT